MKKGFTLVELLAILIALGVIGLIVFPTVNGTLLKSREKLYQSQLDEIKLAAENWAYSNLDMLPSEQEALQGNDSVTITIEELQKGGFLKPDVRDPRNNKALPSDMQIIIKYANKKYIFEVVEGSGSDVNDDISENSPILILNGEPIEYVQVGGTYVDKGVSAKDKSGNIITDTSILYQHNGIGVASIDTSAVKTYTVIYSVSDTVDGVIYTSKITRTVIICDENSCPND